MKGSTLACLAWLSAEKSTQLRTRQNRSCRCSISGDRNGATGSILAPASANSLAAASTAAFTSASTGRPEPASR